MLPPQRSCPSETCSPHASDFRSSCSASRSFVIGGVALYKSAPPLTCTLPFIIHRHDFLGWTVTAIISPIRDRICLQLAPAPSTMNGGPAAGAEQCVFFQRSGNKGHQKGAVSVGTEANQISSAALRTFHAVANTEAHRTCLHSSRQGTSSQVETACPSRSTRCRSWVLERLRRRSREANSPAFCENFHPTVLWDALTWLTANAYKTPAGNGRGRKTASPPALGEQGTSPFAPFVQDCSLATTISRNGLSGTNARGNRYERTVYRHQLTWN